VRYLCPEAIFDGARLLKDHVISLEGQTVASICAPGNLPQEAAVEQTKGVIAPGLFDTQVNGGGDVMLNNQPTPDGVRRMATAHREAGTAFLLPTVITGAAEILEKAADAVLQERGKNGVLGIHIEGPHISIEKKGAHDPAHIRPFDETTLALVGRLRQHDLPVLLTLAPETVPPGTIAKLTQMGVVVAAGHTNATGAQMTAAIKEGLRSATHLFNGMSAMGSREPGVVGAAINSDIWCGIIADGHHVHYDMIRLAANARPRTDRMVLVSDAMSTVGGKPEFQLYGRTIHVEGGRLVNDIGSLAGAHIDMKTSVANLVGHAGVDLCDALRMATVNPRDLMRLPRQTLIGTRLEDLAHLELTS